VFFLLPYVEQTLTGRWKRWRSRRETFRLVWLSGRSWGETFRSGWRTREVRFLLALLVASAMAYVVLSTFINVWGCDVLGIACPGVPSGITGAFVNPSSPGFHSPWTILQSPLLVSDAEYWLLLYALVAFLPLLCPRALVLSVPWIGWTFLTTTSNFTTLGREYSLIAAGPIFIGLAYGLKRIPSEWLGPGRFATSATAFSAREARRPISQARTRRARVAKSLWIAVLAAVVVGNCLVMPMDPALGYFGLQPGTPFASNYFDHSWSTSPGYQWVQQLVSVVPYGAIVVVPAAVFPLFASYPHAYVTTASIGTGISRLPFNATGGPQYVLVEENVGGLGVNLTRNVSEPTLYGMRAYVGTTTLGPLLLYERGYSLPAERLGPAIPVTNASFLPGNGLSAAVRGAEAVNASSPSGHVIQSLPGSKGVGLVWTGPDTLLGPGQYLLRIELAVTGVGLSGHPDTGAVRVEMQGFGNVLVNESFPASYFVPGAWTNLTFVVSVVNPVAKMVIDGYGESPQFSVAVASETLGPE